MVGIPKPETYKTRHLEFCLVFECHLKTEPFHNQTHFDHSKSRCVWYSDPHCTFFDAEEGELIKY